VGRGVHLTWCLVVLLLAGCVQPKPRGIELVHTYAPDELLRVLRRRSDTITTVKAKTDIHIDSPELRGPRSADGLLRYQAPDKVRLMAERDFVGTVFDLASDGVYYELRVLDPETKKLGAAGSGTVAELRRRSETGLAALSLNLGEALGLVRPPGLSVGGRVLVLTYPDRYVIQLLQLRGSELRLLRLWVIDRVTLTCRLIEVFGPAGELVMRVKLGGHQSPAPGLAPIAREVVLAWPEAGITLTLELHRVSANQPLKASLFRL